ncbi:putative serine protease F56F10.1 [Anoplophora glabripennis]|uniref:putative serine protease F56F10.1 n=1 Tax=Anoplophora glabripennis TaxID=217634 RepID=UPI000C75B3C7|nr:putative serine protease F56F10.1 [Anoplophora glabripennis]XP_023311115.1 putative serine protease F56F10.1 [Anoplophora glabripennis]
MSAGSWVEFAKKYSALLFQLEHRFYGVSHPFKDLSVENLRFLSSRQALEDTATFINGMNQEYNLTKDAKWIVFGGSYAGSLAAWLRQKFPHLVQGAVSASGPLFAQLDFHEYMQVVADVLALHSQKCVDTVKTAFARLEKLVDKPGVENITALFNLCQDIRKVNTESDIYSFFETVYEVFSYTVQYDSAWGPSVGDLCGILINETYGDELHRLATAAKLYYNRSACTDYTYQTKIDDMRVLNITPDGNMRQWFYQTCTEYGWYETTNQKEQVFGTKAPTQFFTKMCTDTFGKEYNTKYLTSQIEYTNTYYGGYEIDVQNVVFVQGSYDPWKAMSLTKATDHESPVIYINGTSHCAVLYPPFKRDPPQLIKARAVVEKLIGAWLGVKL